MNYYEQKQEARRERYQALAEQNREKSNQNYETSHRLGEMIPFGQPILVGHHSERGHRSLIDKINNSMRKSIELDKKADYYENRANNISNNISSDDPDAIDKLEIKLAKLEDRQRDMKEQNAEARANKTNQPFASYQLTNNNAVIRNVKLRIKQLTAKKEMIVNEDIIKDWGKLHENKEENRIQFIFNSIPSPEIRSELKHSGFRWSPRNKAWQRALDNRSRYLAKNLITKL
jgi:hypothetical protein